jgi:hypothetical protein
LVYQEGYRLKVRGIAVPFAEEAQTSSAAHLAFCLIVIRGFSPEDKAARMWK